MNNQRCDDCGKAEYPVYQVAYVHPTIEIRNIVNGTMKTISGKAVLKRVCMQCVCLYEKVPIEKEGVFNAK